MTLDIQQDRYMLFFQTEKCAGNRWRLWAPECLIFDTDSERSREIGDSHPFSAVEPKPPTCRNHTKMGGCPLFRSNICDEIRHFSYQERPEFFTVEGDGGFISALSVLFRRQDVADEIVAESDDRCIFEPEVSCRLFHC